MPEEIGKEAAVTGSMAAPFGRGINVQIEVAAVVPFRALQEAWYREGEVEHGQGRLLVQDPDGYLLRCVEVLGTRDAR
ncbi:hypothetical protein [Paragemmobacter ruber]|uniref:hypothetical protein n=1 Tax=Paragemmobacter ruber TaxID=1985673 RepID=UPI00191C5EED|nr:hypothetical protein [Rhodobacter ruber]